MKADWPWLALVSSVALLLATGIHWLALPSLLGLCLASIGALVLPCLRLARQSAKAEPQQVHDFVQHLIDAIPEPVYIKDPEANFLWVNEAFAQERRRPASELIGLSSYDLAPNAQASQLIRSEDSSVLAGGVIVKEQHTTYPVSGEECYRMVSKRLCHAPNGTPLIIGAHFDITRMRQAEAHMQVSLTREIAQRQRIQTYMQRLIDVIPQPVYVKDASSRYLMINQAFCRHRLLSAEQLLGKTPLDLASDPEHALQVMKEDQEVLNGRVIAKEKTSLHPLTGAASHRFISKGCCEDADGHPVIVGANFDITAWRMAEQRWKEASAAKSDFLARMSHEIRTPLAGVIGTLRLALQDQQLAPDSRDYLGNSLASAEALLTIINDLLDFSAFEAGNLMLEHIEFDLHALARELMQRFQAEAQARALKLVLKVDPQLPQYFRGDPMRLNQILANLVSNAIKFTERGQISLRIRANPPHNQQQQIVFCLSDTGIGIAPELVGQLFQMFQQADSSSTQRFGGTGLGLAICRQLVEAMGGKISAVSKPGAGSSFEFDVRLSPTAPPPDAKAEPENLQPHSRRLKILCAEDVRVNQLILRAQLKNLGHDAEMVDNGLLAVKALAAADYDLVLMDCRMPEMDGADATRTIRAGGLADYPTRNPAVRIVAITANASPEECEAYRRAGMDEIISKPVSEAQLHATLSSAIETLA